MRTTEQERTTLEILMMQKINKFGKSETAEITLKVLDDLRSVLEDLRAINQTDELRTLLTECSNALEHTKNKCGDTWRCTNSCLRCRIDALEGKRSLNHGNKNFKGERY